MEKFSVREIIGLCITVLGVVLAPFSYWLSVRWGIASFVLLAVGVPLYLTARVSRKQEEEERGSGTLADPNVSITGAARGFPGHRAFDESPGDGADGE